MGTYLQHYGAGEERRNQIIKRIVLGCIAAVVLCVASYFVFQDFPEKQVAKHFLEQVNSHQYQAAYREWGCTEQHPCPNYDFKRFMEDWGPSKGGSSPWKIANVEGCRSFVTVNVQAQGAELESLAIQRDDHSLGYAPSPECQERKWRWKQFFHRIFGGGSADAPPPRTS
jgi:hypothetical protein